MSQEVENTTIDIGLNLQEVKPKYIYITIPAEYVCVYHRILAMLADYGIEMLKDCKATCTDRNSGVIECYNMFNAAVAAYTLSKGDENSKYGKLAATLIKYIKAKINQIYKGKDNSTGFVFPIDETGDLKAFVSCEDLIKFWINPDDMKLYSHKFDGRYDEHFRLGPEDESDEGLPSSNDVNLTVVVDAHYELVNEKIMACADVSVTYNNVPVPINSENVEYYFDGVLVNNFNDVRHIAPGIHSFGVLVKKDGKVGFKTVSRKL